MREESEDAFREFCRSAAAILRLETGLLLNMELTDFTLLQGARSVLKYMVHGRKRPNQLLAATSKTRRKVQSIKEMAEVVGDMGERQGRGQKLAKIV